MLRFLLRTAIGTEQIYGGTYEYLAPEAMAGATRANQDAIVARETQDAYSVGVTAYQVVTRNHLPPFAMEVCRHPVLLCMLFFFGGAARVTLCSSRSDAAERCSSDKFLCSSTADC